MKQRVVSSCIMLIICVPFIILGGIYFKIFASILSCMCLFELLKYQKNIPKIMNISSFIFLILILFKNELKISLENVLLLLILFYMFSLIFLKNTKYNYKHTFLLIGLIIFIGLAFNSIIEIRMKSLDELIYLLLISIGTDSFALILGKKFGKNKLAPSISPNKTIEGLIGGSLVGTLIASLFYIIKINIYHKIFITLIFTFVLSIIGQLGDLVKSSIKRTIDIKDFSNLIPGHGGILDRLDSLIFISITYILFIKLI